MEMLRELLAPEVGIEVPMASEFLDEEEQLDQLTHEQTMLLRRFGRDQRMVVTGCAGSGKTMLAVEQAKWLAREGQGRAVRLLQPALCATTCGSARGDSGVDFLTFHGLCVAPRASRPGVELPELRRRRRRRSSGTRSCRTRWSTRSTSSAPQYDALIVDEAQDLHNHWLDALMCDAPRRDEALVWLFMDDNQQVYDARLDVPTEFRPFDLTVNCRNTQAIHREVMKKYEGEVEPEVDRARGPRRRADPHRRPGRRGRRRDRAALRQGGGAAAGRRRPLLARLRELRGRRRPAAGPLPASSRSRASSATTIHFSSIRGFKGLESPVVILCELEDLDDDDASTSSSTSASRGRGTTA